MTTEVRVCLGGLQAPVDATLDQLDREDFARRVWKKDPTLWKGGPAVQHRLGWLEIARTMQSHTGDLNALANDLRSEGYRYVVLLGMGGSSLGPEVLRQTFGTLQGAPPLLVVDTTDPAYILKTEKAVELDKTVFIVSSKSGLTLETNAFMAYFLDKVKQVRGEEAGQHFLAITDPGSRLEKFAREQNFREVFLNPADLGGRYSILSYVGLVPAAIAGYDIKQMIGRAVSMAEECRKPGLDNPGLHLGAIIGAAAQAGRDKVTLCVPPSLASYGLWVEQLIAESTAKGGFGVVPVVGEELADPADYGSDRLFISIELDSQKQPQVSERLKKLEEAGHPTVRLRMHDLYDLAAEFYRWEFATGVVGAVLGVYPFDEPNLAESLENTRQLLAQYVETGQLPGPPLIAGEDGLSVSGIDGTPEQALATLFQQLKPGDYLALLAYLDPEDGAEERLAAIRRLVQQHYRVATTVGYGPRYLHSTGQLHKGGPNNGVFLLVLGGDPTDLPIPGQKYSFSILKQAQAFGDLEALQTHGRRVLLVQPGVDWNDVGLEWLEKAVQTVISER